MKEMTVLEINELLKDGSWTSERLIRHYLMNIENRNPRLNALADLNHHALHEAIALDQERRNSGPRSPLHGIPILLKDNILTNDTMRTTANARVFKDFYAPYDATIVKKLRDAGAIILSKASLSEFAYYMSNTTMPSGFGSLFGQVRHPYDEAIDPLGSSTGSAVGVAADLAPIAIGTETNGSLVSPAMANSVVTIKPTVGLVSRYGIIPVSSLQDTAGPLSKTVKDSALMLDIIKGMDSNDGFTNLIPQKKTDYLSACEASIQGKRIGLLNYEKHVAKGEAHVLQQEAKEILQNHGAEVVELTHPYDLPNNTQTLSPEFHRDMNLFLKTIKGYTEVETLSDIVRFNHQDRRRNLKHGQGLFIGAVGSDITLKDSFYLKARRETDASIKRFKALFDDHKLDAIMTTTITGYAPVGGLPCIGVPAKALSDQKPISMQFIGLPFSEETLLPLAYTYEKTTQKRVAPFFKV